MSDDIVMRLRVATVADTAKSLYQLMTDAADEIELLRKMVADWEQTAQMLAVDLGKVEYAQAIYEDIQDGLYDKVRERMKK